MPVRIQAVIVLDCCDRKILRLARTSHPDVHGVAGDRAQDRLHKMGDHRLRFASIHRMEGLSGSVGVRDLYAVTTRHDAADVFEAALLRQQAELLQREGTFVAACLGRHISELAWSLERRAQAVQIAEVPFLHEFFVMLYNHESMFRNRKVFTV